ncbi:hypothetical protein H1R20_g214, partial [Candolleomyces eurysporus]
MQRNRGVANMHLSRLGIGHVDSAPGTFVGFSEPTFAPPVDASFSSASTSPPNSPSPSPVLPDSDAVQDLVEELHKVRDQIRDAQTVVDEPVFYFANPPSLEKAIHLSNLDAKEIDKICSLDTFAPTNSTILGYQATLARAKAFAALHVTNKHVLISLQASLTMKKVETQEKALRNILVKEYRRQRSTLKEVGFFKTDAFYTSRFRLLPTSVLAIYLLVATVHHLSHVSLDVCSFILRCIRLAFSIVLATSTSIHAPSVSKSMFIDARTVIDILDVEPRSHAYIVCPRCSKIYWVDPKAPPADAPTRCAAKQFGSQCQTPLFKTQNIKDGTAEAPRRQYHHQPLKEYISRLYSRPDLQEYLDRDPTEQNATAGETWDIWDSPGLREFKGKDGKTFVKVKGEGRLIFSLNMDGFNPYGNREAGKTVSVGAIYMVCLNLPPSIRHKMENIYLAGILPGPHTPSDHEINHFLRPLVDDLLDLWDNGIFVSRTAKHPYGRRVRCALGPLICDLPASRQMSGFAHYRTRNFCSECDRTLDQINDLSPTWKPRTWAKHLAAAKRWRDAGSVDERERLVKKDGARWSELLRLPYWDPTKFTLIDSMHAFYLRMFQHHCRSVWGMDVRFDDGPGVTLDCGLNQPSEEEMRIADQILRHGTEKMLSAQPRSVLRELCRQTTTIPFRRNKAQLIEELKAYRIRQKWFTETGVHLGDPADVEKLDNPGNAEGSHLPLLGAESVNSFYLSASKSKLRRLKKPELLILFREKVLPFQSISDQEVEKMTVPMLKDRIEQQRRIDGLTDENDCLIAIPPKKTRVLGKQTLAEIRKDIERLTQPTWVSRAPSRPGEKRYGKFTADQWRAFCMLILPITLTRLWGTKPEGSVERRRLDNFMHLVSAVKLATMHKLTESRIQQYEYHIRCYLETLLELFPGTSITPYQHLSLHFGQQLRLFGPVHAWRCFPFERFNYILQKIPTNEMIGEIEKTMFIKFCCTQNIKVIYHTTQLPQQLHEMIRFYEDNYASDLRGTRLSDAFAEDDRFGVVDEVITYQRADFSVLADDDFSLLKAWMLKHQPEKRSFSREVIRRNEIFRFGQKFTSRDHSMVDSHVIFKEDDNEEWQAGSILGIFSHATIGGKATQTWAVIRPYQELSLEDTEKDPYLMFPVINGALFQNSWANSAVLVEVTDIIAHFASCVLQIDGLAEECRLVLPLNKYTLLSFTIRTSVGASLGANTPTPVPRPYSPSSDTFGSFQTATTTLGSLLYSPSSIVSYGLGGRGSGSGMGESLDTLTTPVQASYSHSPTSMSTSSPSHRGPSNPGSPSKSTLTNAHLLPLSQTYHPQDSDYEHGVVLLSPPSSRSKSPFSVVSNTGSPGFRHPP